MPEPLESPGVKSPHRSVSQDPQKRARSLANLRPFTKNDPRTIHRGRPKTPLSDALLAKLVRRRALAVAQALISRAEEGDVPAFKELADRVEGKVAEKFEVTGNLELGLRIAAARARVRSASDDGEIRDDKS